MAPIRLPIQEKLVYSGHIYTFSGPIAQLPWFVFEPLVYQLQDFVTQPGHDYSAAFWLGETGTGEDSDEWQNILRSEPLLIE